MTAAGSDLAAIGVALLPMDPTYHPTIVQKFPDAIFFALITCLAWFVFRCRARRSSRTRSGSEMSSPEPRR